LAAEAAKEKTVQSEQTAKESPKGQAQKADQQPPQTAKQAEPLYSKEDIIAAASAFGTSPYVVAGALRFVEKDMLTRSEAEAAIKDFLRREV
jgi:hypothetical protein